MLKFAHTREDPAVELLALDLVRAVSRHSDCPGPLKIAVIASGGCTALTLLTLPFPIELHIVDSNSAQLDLFQYKYSLLWSCGDVKEARARYQSLTQLLDSCATFEKLFAQLRRGESLQQVFGTENLIQEFGPDAVKHSHPFVPHLNQVLAEMRSYFRDLVLTGSFQTEFPPFLTPSGFAGFEHAYVSSLHKIIYHHSNVSDFLAQQPSSAFDVIHLSNITDWLSPVKRLQLLTLAYHALRPCGRVSVRRFNGAYSLAQLLRSSPFTNLSNLSNLHQLDSSAFYQEVYIPQKSQPRLSKL
jgi:S-adenosylmethionine-diacylglycerol 3-amino-3-carboxypropyl transferase